MNEHAPGWYEHDGERRYWDGTRWTHSTSMPATPSTPPAQPGNAVSPYTPPPPYGAAHTPGPPPVPPYAPLPGGPGGMPVARKEPALSLLASFLIPGVGSMINGDVGAGVGFLSMYLLGLALIVCLGWILIGLIGVPLVLVAWGWGMYHAYQGAVEHNRAVGYPG